jgi:hypothetical protein
VAHYRLYCFDGADKVWAAEWIEADSDDAAIQAARGLHAGVKCEIWQGNRLVAALDLGVSAAAAGARPPPRTGRTAATPD